MTRIWKDFHFAIAYFDDIIIFSKTAEDHLDHITSFWEGKKYTHVHETQ